MGKQKSMVVILSAARSGSKLFRDVLGQHPEISTIPYDINYVWKYGNYAKHDELEVTDAKQANSRFIQSYICAHTKNDQAKIILEKTVSNTLRVDFVRAVFPQVKFIHLYRDGRDVALSARSCWNASSVSSKNQSKSILIKKIKNYPYIKTFPYISDKVIERLKYKFGIKKSLPIWGPQFNGIEAYLDQHDLLEVCAKQWAVCVSKSLDSLQKLNHNKDYISVSYEEFIGQPEHVLRNIANFLDISDITAMLDFANNNFNSQYIGLWKHKMTQTELQSVINTLKPVLVNLGYEMD